MPSQPLTSGLQEIDFSYDVIEPMIQIGMDDAAIMINSTQPGDSFRKFDEWYKDSDGSLKAKHLSLSAYLYSDSVKTTE